ncbi:SPOR domain-containing protein [Pelagibacterium lentulum]|uniref:SPOR domain-containing protein n=1 Tax=Pelagibacterium lentulum TaxID=2029865 RepID=A0A916REN1_9HYPH|nr:SPOR domain-containing protein [Pelagibacterium lentulum]GGA53340.1 hypothetical protein GCM10011499_24360 [Pelagibacterium lentulum]
MDTTKQDQQPDNQDSDDLIAELARLVAQDARNASGGSLAPRRVEPTLDAPATQAEPVVSAGDLEEQASPARPEPSWSPDISGERAPAFEARREPDVEATPGFRDERSVSDAALPDFDFGFAPQPQAYDAGHSRQEPEWDEPEERSPEPQLFASEQQVEAAPHADSTYDPIADLIANAEDDSNEDFEAAPIDEAAYFESESTSAEPEKNSVSADALENWSFDADEITSGRSARPEAAERDPLSEIEALIGQAAHVSSAAGPVGERRVKSSFLSDDQTEWPETTSSPEAAILAAQAAAAAVNSAPAYRPEPAFEPEPAPAPVSPAHAPEPDWRFEPAPEPEHQAQPEPEPVPEPEPLYTPEPAFEAAPLHARAVAEEPGEGDYFEHEDVSEKPRRRSRDGIVGLVVPALLGTLIIAGLGGIYFTFFSGEGDTGEAPVLAADGEPIRIEPEQTTNTTTASQSVVFNELDGNAPTGEEVLVSRDQTNGASGNTISQIISSEDGEIGLANRAVRTVTVRPDGTIVTSEDSMAGGTVLPVDRPDVPAMPDSALANDPIGQAIASAMGAESLSAATPEPAASASDAGGQSATIAVGEEAPTGVGVFDPSSQNTSQNGNAPTPIARPQGLSAQQPAVSQPQTLTPPSTTEVATLQQPAATPAPPPATTASNAPIAAWVQLSSQRSEEVARAGMAELQTRYGSLFNGGELEVSRVDLDDRGIYYRVRLGQPSVAEANSVCNAIRAQGGDCFVLNN